MGRRIGTRVSIETRIKQRNSLHTKLGSEAGYIENALDFYLCGVPIDEIAKTYDVTQSAIYAGMARAALYRLMILHSKKRIDQLDEIT